VVTGGASIAWFRRPEAAGVNRTSTQTQILIVDLIDPCTAALACRCMQVADDLISKPIEEEKHPDPAVDLQSLMPFRTT
jgi:hypothetical protein